MAAFLSQGLRFRWRRRYVGFISTEEITGFTPVLLPASFEPGEHRVDHRAGDAGVDAYDAAELVADPLVLQDLGDAVFDHPGLVGVALCLPNMSSVLVRRRGGIR